MTLSTLLTIAVPEIIILIAAMSVLLLGVFYKNTTSLFGITQLTLLIAAYFTAQLPIDVKLTAFNDMFIVDSLSMFLKLLSYFALSLVLIYSRSFLQIRNLHNGEFYALTLFALLGINLIISSYHLLSLYMGLELLSLSLYTLVAFDRNRPEASEAAMKYFVLGAVASGFLLYGFSMLYGITGSLQIAEISSKLTDASINPVVLSFALVFVVVGIAFKFGAAPFQLWVPDVYQGAATPITMFIGSVPKFASVAMLIRLLFQGLDHMVLDWQAMLLIMAIVSMLFGNITAIAQTKIKRLLAYSAISHVGFMFLGLATGTITGIASALMYIAVYVLMTLASFGLIIHLSNQGKELDQITDLSGLGKQKPWLAFLLLLIFLSLAGIPPTIGFYAKFSIIQATVQFGWIWPAIIAVMSALIGIFYYLRIIKVAYFDEPGKNLDQVSKSSNNELSVTLSINTLALLIIGLFPSSLMDIATLTSALIF
ncbi:MAG: NADH-quinone oxidoreductase subunit NuoN [Methylophilaceae bacterium]|jgi:NADH-quinone oxidoreductase subunit N|nr:NADH-quinone oxidoreductase subunit NuoN [Methylophilaceae bacterium]NCW63026.1 NADH-quinone oxidoreductase subunit NuoN [Betaproteobacteria bacterium]